MKRLAFPLVVLLLAASVPTDTHRLPTGVVLDPAGVSIGLGAMPVTMLFSPDSSRIVTVLSGYRSQGFQVVDRGTRRVVQTVVQPAAFLGAAFAPDGHTLCVSGGNLDHVYVYAWGDTAALVDSIALAPTPGPDGGIAYPAHLAFSRDGKHLFVAENLRDTLAVVDVAARRVVQELPTGRYPYGVLVLPDDRVCVSIWGGNVVETFAPAPDGRLARGPRIQVGRHPSAMVCDRAGTKLYVACASSDRIAVVDLARNAVSAVIDDAVPGGPHEGSTPNGLALSPDGSRLCVAEADNNAVAVFDVVGGRLRGRIPVEWYPTAVLASADSLWVLNGKGKGSRPNPRFGHPGTRKPLLRTEYSIGQLSGSLTALRLPGAGDWADLSRRVMNANGWTRERLANKLPPFRHVVYVIRENRTYDQVMGDLAVADGDTALVYFPRAVTPNAHALAERFGIYDRFFVNAEVSADGHNWTTAAYATDYVEKTVPSVYAGRGRSYEYEGFNRNETTDEDVAEPANGYLWDLARKAKVSLRNYGEFGFQAEDGHWTASKKWLAAHTSPDYPGWDLTLPDTLRAEKWLKEFRGQVAGDSMPALTILRLPNDHTAGVQEGGLTPRAMVADNDLALGRVIEAISRSKFWASTLILVLEDDAQDGPDHVDCHRSPLLVISAYNRPGVVHRFANTSDVIATIDRVLGLGSLSNFDFFGEPLVEVFAAKADPAPYVAIEPPISRLETNPVKTKLGRLNRKLDLRKEDRADEDLFNRILWAAIKGPDRPYPQPKSVETQDLDRSGL